MTKARKSITIKIKYKGLLRQVAIKNVERLRNCRKPQSGYKVYQCPECGKNKYVPFTCKSRLCTSCGTKAANEWADKIHHKLLKVPHRLQKILFEASRVTMEKMIRLSNKRSKKKVTVTMDKFEFVHGLLSHIPEKNFKKKLEG